MSQQVFTVHGGDSLDAAERLMGDKRIRRVPVIDGDNRPIGFISLGDIARYTAAIRKKNGQDRAVVETLAAISQPRVGE
jgi:CBS domain-containing protein